uniref:BZIP domain-containing protein n=1 Tax=Rhabditophanes sp. KR3021 TaxID=114890 RepID=A0AC35U8P4_9BILA
MQYSPSPPPYNDPIALLNEGDDDEVPINRQGPAVVKIEYHTYYNGSNVASEHHKHPSYAVSRNNPLFGANQQRRIQEALKKKKAQMARKIKKTMFAEAEREKALEDVNDRRERVCYK